MISIFPCLEPASIRHNDASKMRFITLELAKEGAEKPAGQMPWQENDGLSASEALRILIVEDVLMAAWHLESLIQDLKLQPCGFAAHGEEAIVRAAELQPNLLLMDINLGTGMDGIEAARRIRETMDAAIIFVTAYSDAATLERIERVVPGAPVLAKPVTLEALRAAIVGVCKAKPD